MIELCDRMQCLVHTYNNNNNMPSEIPLGGVWGSSNKKVMRCEKRSKHHKAKSTPSANNPYPCKGKRTLALLTYNLDHVTSTPSYLESCPGNVKHSQVLSNHLLPILLGPTSTLRTLPPLPQAPPGASGAPLHMSKPSRSRPQLVLHGGHSHLLLG
ncbi:hypothetical protein H5410_057812 [Solanum commersonii]|uniref:Uncharacterized protein n=1 Tax=Solanum commersonii TaxID=4109 RepID=A0A9J5WRW4_SOLCO|nr:hypothetical protein H5410_057812 [Solanum commersonii]